MGIFLSFIYIIQICSEAKGEIFRTWSSHPWLPTLAGLCRHLRNCDPIHYPKTYMILWLDRSTFVWLTPGHLVCKPAAVLSRPIAMSEGQLNTASFMGITPQKSVNWQVHTIVLLCAALRKLTKLIYRPKMVIKLPISWTGTHICLSQDITFHKLIRI